VLGEGGFDLALVSHLGGTRSGVAGFRSRPRGQKSRNSHLAGGSLKGSVSSAEVRVILQA
jgi:hypothetical protein